MTIHIDYQVNEKDAEIIEEGLSQFNTSHFGNKKCISFLTCLKDEDQKTVGGILAWMLPGIELLCIDTLWISEPLRNQGHGKALILAAEAEGIKHGCTYSQLETLPFQAEEFYKKLGYVRIGILEKFYGEHDAIYMRKKL